MAETLQSDSVQLQSEKRPLEYKDELQALRLKFSGGELSGVRKFGKDLCWG